MAEVTDIITKLLERTNENKVSWQTTADEDTFIAVVGNTSTLVYGYGDPRSRQEVQFRILNSEGREIERYDTKTEFDQLIEVDLVELFTKARRVALGVDSQLDELLKALDE